MEAIHYVLTSVLWVLSVYIWDMAEASARSQIPLINVNADISSKARGPHCGFSLQLHPYFVYTSSDDAHESAHMQLFSDVISTEICNFSKSQN